ncbi:MAG: hypothetical protein E6R03_12130 [Hyphomicrobiaceae bacterium]|nr:MAG: hypothetical protein E6R03_12130 [Hyphomicrobiaceae bacterium]
MAAKKKSVSKTAAKAGAKTDLDKARAALKLGGASTDVLAKRAGIDSRKMSKALAKLKARGESHFKKSRDGENIHRRGKARS